MPNLVGFFKLQLNPNSHFFFTFSEQPNTGTSRGKGKGKKNSQKHKTNPQKCTQSEMTLALGINGFRLPQLEQRANQNTLLQSQPHSPN